MTPKRWFLYDYETSRFAGTLEGHPHDHPGWEGFEQKLNRDGCVVKEWGVLVVNGRRVRARQLEVAPPRDPSGPCSTNCLRATQPECDCSCQGVNHGKENRGLAEGAEPLDVVWDGG